MRKNRVYRVIVAAAGETSLLANAEKTTLDNANPGQLGVFNAQSWEAVTAGETIEDHEEIIIVQTTSSGIRTSIPIQGAQVRKYNGEEYRDEQAKSISVDLGGLPGITTVGSEVFVTVIFKTSYSPDLLPYRQYRKTFRVNADNSTEADAEEFASRIADLINKDLDIEVSASVSTDTITITANNNLSLDRSGQYPNQIDFDVAAGIAYYNTNGVLVESDGATITTVADIDFGSGTDRHMRLLEDRSQGYLGYTNRTLFPADLLEYYAVSGGNYDLYVIEHDDRHEVGEFLTDVYAPCTTIIAVPDSNSTLKSALEGVLNPYMASTPKNFPAVTLTSDS